MNKTPNFIEFRLFRKRIGSNFIGITKNGTISIYSGLYLANKIKGKLYCLILVDKEQNLIGLQFDGLRGKGLYKVKHIKNSCLIFAHNFFKVNNFNILDWYGKYNFGKIKNENGDDIFMIDLQNKI